MPEVVPAVVTSQGTEQQVVIIYSTRIQGDRVVSLPQHSNIYTRNPRIHRPSLYSYPGVKIELTILIDY